MCNFSGGRVNELMKRALKSYRFRTFTVAAPFLWNSLPLEVKSSPSLNIFKSKLKTHLFKCAFNLN